MQPQFKITKPEYISNSYVCPSSQSQQEQYSSFQSQPIKAQQSQKQQGQQKQNQPVRTINAKNNKFTYHSCYKQRNIQFPSTPPDLPKLYQIYLYNQNRKKELKNAIKGLIQRQLKVIRVKYDQRTMAIEQFIDIEQESDDYSFSKQKYEQRTQNMKVTQKQYEKLKIKQIQSIMQSTQQMRSMLLNYCSENKQIITWTVNSDEVRLLCKEKKHHKSNRIQNNFHNKQTLPQLDKTKQSQDHHENIVNKFVIRSFKFYQCSPNDDSNQSKIAFHPLLKSIQLPNIANQYLGIVYQIKQKIVIVHDGHSLYFIKGGDNQNEHLNKQGLKDGSKILKNKVYVANQKIIFVGTVQHKLYVGTQDGIIRLYKMENDCQIVLEKIMGCFLQEYAEISHFCLTKSPEIILFVESNKRLCIMNLNTYSSYLLAELPDKVLKLSEKLLITEKQVYAYYYHFTGPQVKASLVPSPILQNRYDTIIQLTQVQGKPYYICNGNNGQFEIHRLMK